MMCESDLMKAPPTKLPPKTSMMHGTIAPLKIINQSTFKSKTMMQIIQSPNLALGYTTLKYQKTRLRGKGRTYTLNMSCSLSNPSHAWGRSTKNVQVLQKYLQPKKFRGSAGSLLQKTYDTIFQQEAHTREYWGCQLESIRRNVQQKSSSSTLVQLQTEEPITASCE